LPADAGGPGPRRGAAGLDADRGPAPLPRPFLLAVPGPGPRTGLVLLPRADAMPAVVWAGPVPGAGLDPAAVAGLADATWHCALLPEHAGGWFGRPGLSGHRLGRKPVAGRDWSPRFRPVRVTQDGPEARLEGADDVAGLALATELQAVPGGAVRGRHTLTNTGDQPYVVDSLEVVFPLPGEAAETLDFTGRANLERVPQRRGIADGLWLREGRRGRPGHDAATVLVAGQPGFAFGHGRVWGLHVGWSGNTVHRVERLPSGLTTIGGGELLLPGEVVLAAGQSCSTPWVYLAAAGDGLDGLAAEFHGYLRSLPAHPASPRPVNLNVWEAVTFDHGLARLTSLADIAAGLGVERYVLDDGWFRGRRDDTAGLGDWWVDEETWPGGLHPLVDHVRSLGMQFGLWFEPEMVNPDSGLYRAHPDWILATGQRVPPLQRDQLVLDLTRPEVSGYLLERISAVLSCYDISYVKWDHNRDLVDAGSAARAGAPAAGDQVRALYALLDELRERHPGVEWESCASGGGRVDLGILERTQRIWVSDSTDALARQSIQRWTGQLAPPEYCGAHVSAPVSGQTGRHLPLALRAATALFGHFGIEWDLTAADEASLAELAGWIRLYKTHRALLHSGRVVRLDVPDDSMLIHGVVAADRSAALMSYVQLAESGHTRAAALRVPGLEPARAYRVTDVTPGAGPDAGPDAGRPDAGRPDAGGPDAGGPDAGGAFAGTVASGAALGEIGMAVPVRRPHAAAVYFVTTA
jgi:alpha-galactosidase